jgi:hypothetical protein
MPLSGVLVRFDRLDAELRAGLGPAATAALGEWATQSDVTFRLGYWLTNADSITKVGLVREDGDGGTRNIILKLDGVRGGSCRERGGTGLGEFARQRRAIQGRRRFAARHLVEPVHLPLRVGDGTWLLFHEVAGGSIRDFATLGNVLDGLLRPEPRSATRPGSPVVSCDAEGFARTCADLVRSILVEWTQQPRIVTATVPEFLDWHMYEGDEGGVADMTAHAAGSSAHFDRGAPRLDALALLTHGVVIPAIVGKAHGDLRLDNVLVPVRPKVGVAGYRLFDLSAYSDHAPLTCDVVNLMLHTVARALPDLSPSQRDALTDLLVDRAQVGPLIPGWLHTFVTRVEATAEEWARRFSLVDEWREQVPLSVFACASGHAAGIHVSDEDRTWFRTLAARAGAAFMARRTLAGIDVDAHPVSAPAGPTEPTGGHAPAVPRTVEPGRVATGSSPVWPGEGARPSAEVELSPAERDALVRALARAFPTDAFAHRILHTLGFPAERRRSVTDSTPLAAWSETLHDLDNGIVADPYPRLLLAAILEFPHNQTFRNLGARFGVLDGPVDG